MLGRTDRRMRMVALLVAFAVFAGAAVARLTYWQVSEAPRLAAKAISYMAPPSEPEPARAAIVDRDGVALARPATYDRLAAYPRTIPADRRAELVEVLAVTLGLDDEKRQAYLAALSTDENWTSLERRLTAEQSVAVQLRIDEGALPGITLEPLPTRVYPKGGGQIGTSLASHLVGFVAGESGGAAGVERLYDDRLAGRVVPPVAVAGIGMAATNGSGLTADGLAGTELADLEVPPLELTIDAGLQRKVESIISTIRAEDRAKSVSAIVMNPHTGEILASASVPGYDANQFGRVFLDDPSLLRDRVVSDVYEPGSVMKMFTVGAALSEGIVTPSTVIADQIALRFGPGVKPVRNSDRGSIGRRPVRTMIAESRNVATAKLAMKLAGNTQRAGRILYDLWDAVGLVGRTGVDVAGEEAGLFPDPADKPWHPNELANRAFGQGLATTLVQLATGYATLMNGGYRVQPHVVRESDAAAVPRERVLKPRVAKQTQEIMEWVTGSVYRYAKGALVPGYMIGGKTGTAQIWDFRRKRWKDRFNHTFVGYVGTNRPDYLIAVRIEEAKPISKKKEPLDLKIESYEAFHMLAIPAIEHLDIRKSRDPDAGWPIRGTDAFRKLTPDRPKAKPKGAERRADAGDETRGERTGAARDREGRDRRSEGGAASRARGDARSGTASDADA
jgi:cell division protein FtsI (penicillin-binding protein 3)